LISAGKGKRQEGAENDLSTLELMGPFQGCCEVRDLSSAGCFGAQTIEEIHIDEKD
jgi:hypothetical protein